MGDQNDEMYLAELQACKLDFLEWTPEKGVKVSDTSKQFAREFLNLLVVKDSSKTNEYNGAKKTFNQIASLLIQCKAGNDGTIPKETIDEIAEQSGTTDRRVYTVLKALGTEGWKPSKVYEERTNDQL
ncbi:hypothetical protein [Methanosarcina sp. UBA5]|uniref:hypothetical protein n=1 Tax=Methanosarcina sp. UBA5 TaxID=1915593 RepID=UPI0025DE4D50|nr:hypothetical protein [Methanosarcina sp. UBA5]